MSARTTPSHSRHHSRRSTANNLTFTHSISPLTTTTLTESHFSRPNHVRSSSYIANRSVPSTPGLLSSKTVPHTPKHRTPARTPTKEAFDLHSADYFAAKIKKSRSVGSLVSDEEGWMTRTGAAFASVASESKGQAWLTTRASSTSLVDEYPSDDEEVVMEQGEVMWGDIAEEEEDREEEEEGRGFELGMWVDRIVGWGLWADESEDEEEDDEEMREKRERQRRLQRELEREVEEAKRRERRERRDEEEGWQDPAWVLSLAASILF